MHPLLCVLCGESFVLPIDAEITRFTPAAATERYISRGHSCGMIDVIIENRNDNERNASRHFRNSAVILEFPMGFPHTDMASRRPTAIRQVSRWPRRPSDFDRWLGWLLLLGLLPGLALGWLAIQSTIATSLLILLLISSGLPSRSGNPPIVTLWTGCRNVDAGRKDKPGDRFLDRNRLNNGPNADMKILYHDLSEDQFERLVLVICTWLLGPAVQGFSKGPDGGKDARFCGRAERFPSTTGPWDGRIVIQAKHTDLINRKFSEPDFASDANSSILSEEFSNRRLAGVAEERLRKRIAIAAGIDDTAVYLAGTEDIDKYLDLEPDLRRRAGIDRLFDIDPFIDPGDLARVIQGLAEARGCLAAVPGSDIPPPEQRVGFAEKNLINGLSADYAALVKTYLKDFAPVQGFLAAPENAEHLGWYTDTVDDLNGLIQSQRRPGQPFDEILDRTLRKLFDRDYDLRNRKRLTRTLLYYMYWNCDLGRDSHA
jgi:hypothetical protein